MNTSYFTILYMANKIVNNDRMSGFKFPKEPIYIPKLQDGNVSDWSLKLPVICVNAMTLAWRPSTLSLRDQAEVFIVDPVTDRLLLPEARKKKNFKKLGYPEAEPEDMYSDSSVRRKLIEAAIKNQVDANASILIAPYLFAEDTDDTKFTVNLTLLSETVKYLQEVGEARPLFAMICIGNSVFTRPTVLNHIIDRYNDDFTEHVSGFILSINEFSGRGNPDQSMLIGLANFVYRLSEYKPVVMKRIDAFGEVLCAIGAAGYSSGLAISETYSVKNQEDTPRKAVRRIYAAEIFDYLNDEEAKKIGYECHNNSSPQAEHPQDHHTKTKHYLHHKMDRVNKMQSLNRQQRIDFMLQEIKKGEKLASEWNSKFGIPPKFLHATRWKTVLDQACHWKPSKQDDAELKKLLEELEND